ncbi:hypothetical protein Q5P01_000844 [Channa striata]|uniref:Uncharacterized protein n=1 Tax=Channa striata TaxID=64152 RepID=A0AA88LEM8_CHASR|nr:hypothetical protein Q5P01_000844 [Channa striata]
MSRATFMWSLRSFLRARGCQASGGSRRACAGSTWWKPALGFTEETLKVFLAQAKDDAHSDSLPRGARHRAPQLKRPCMANIATRPTRRPRVRRPGGTATAGRRGASAPIPKRRRGAWALFELTGAAKQDLVTTRKALESGRHGSEEKFAPAAASPGGLFGINIQICAGTRLSRRQHPSRQQVARGVSGVQSQRLVLRNLPGLLCKETLRFELDSEDCYHKGTYRATRLNGSGWSEWTRTATADSTPNDTDGRGQGDVQPERRRELARRTAAFV